MFGLTKYFMIGGVVLLFALSTLFYFYYKDTQARILSLNLNNANLVEAIQMNQETIITMQANAVIANAEISRINDSFSAIKEQNRILIDKLSEHNIGFLAANKPVLVERIINNASDKTRRCFELLSGAELTSAEINAKTPKEANSECPWVFE